MTILRALLLLLILTTAADAGQLTATWTDNSLGAASTAIERRLEPGGTYSLMATVLPGVTTWVDPTPQDGVTYCYRAYAFTSAEVRSPDSIEACAMVAGTAPPPPPPPAPFTVTLTKTGTGTGRVTTEPAGIDCGPVCTGSFTSKVTLTATPDATSTFAGWGGVCAGTTGACTFSVSAGASVGVSADFALIPPPPPPPADTTSPTVAFTMTSNVLRKAKVPVAITASDDRAVVRVELYVSGGLVGSVNAGAGTVIWSVPNAAQKSYTLQAKAYDAAGNVGLSQKITVYPR